MPRIAKDVAEFNGGKGYLRAYFKVLDAPAPANPQTFIGATQSGNSIGGFAKIPGYDAYCRRYGNTDAGEYAFTTLHGCLVDPFLEMYRGMGFTVPDRNHVIKDFYPDPPSRDYGALVVRRVRSAAQTGA